jgi:hypothetical protein
VQFIDPGYYQDRDAALAELFALATFLVAPRGTDDAPALAALLDQPANRRFAGAVRPLSLPSHLRGVASSSIRGALAKAAGATADEAVPAIHEAMPPPVAQFVAATGVYTDEVRYRRRCDIIAEVVGASGQAPPTPSDLARYREQLRGV